jgi:hypothetical protein
VMTRLSTPFVELLKSKAKAHYPASENLKDSHFLSLVIAYPHPILKPTVVGWFFAPCL